VTIYRSINAAVESIIGLYKSELITMRGPWRSVEDVELATLSWVHWWNTSRLHSAIGDLPPVEFETAHYAQQHPAGMAWGPPNRASTEPGVIHGVVRCRVVR
jgi:hypothetical protein